MAGSKIHLTRGNARTVHRNSAHYTVHREGNFVVVRSNPTGLVVKWDGNMGIHVYLTNAYRGKVSSSWVWCVVLWCDVLWYGLVRAVLCCVMLVKGNE